MKRVWGPTNFALKCDELRKAADIEEAEKILNSMGAEFFSNQNRKKTGGDKKRSYSRRVQKISGK